MGQGREEIVEAFPGDVVGLFDPGIFAIGDTLCQAPSQETSFEFPGIPSFSPEHFVRVDVAGVSKRKALAKGIDQLVQEGAVQLFNDPMAASATLILGAVGPLQFEVLAHRLASEYQVDLKLVPMPYTAARWPVAGFDPSMFSYSETVRVVRDRENRPVLLFKTAWSLSATQQRHPDLVLSETADQRQFSKDLAALR